MFLIYIHNQMKYKACNFPVDEYCAGIVVQ